MLEQNIDTVVLGCTHYPFVIALIQQIVGENVRVIDPAPAVARQALRLLDGSNLRRPAWQPRPTAILHIRAGSFPRFAPAALIGRSRPGDLAAMGK